MSTRSALMAATSPFAHFLGLPSRAAAPAPAKPAKPAPADDEGDENPEPAPEKPEKPENDPDAPDDQPNDPNAPAADPNADDEDDEDDGAAEDEGDDQSDDKEMRPKARARAARVRERARCAAIFRDKAASANPALACELAFRTNLSRSAAIGALRTAATSRGALGAMMNRAGVPAVNAGASSGLRAGSVDALVAEVLNAGKSASK